MNFTKTGVAAGFKFFFGGGKTVPSIPHAKAAEVVFRFLGHAREIERALGKGQGI